MEASSLAMRHEALKYFDQSAGLRARRKSGCCHALQDVCLAGECDESMARLGASSG